MSKHKLNGAHADLSTLYASLQPSDQAALRFLQGECAFLKDSVCFLSMVAHAAERAYGSGYKGTGASADPFAISNNSIQPREERELNALVHRFVTMERREKVFCNLK